MSDDLIRRSDAIDAITNHCENECYYRADNWCPQCQREEFEKAINAIPSADRPSAVDLSNVYSTAYKSGYEKGKADRPKGEWIYGEHDVAMCDGYRCDRCGLFVPWDYEHKSIDFINDYHFCPNCGARMKGADDE